MKAAIVKINYELIDEIIRESFGMNLMPETDRAIFYRISLDGGNSGIYAFGASAYAPTIEATKDFYKVCDDAKTANRLIKNISCYEDFALCRLDRRSMLRLIGEHIAAMPISGMQKRKYYVAGDFFGEAEEDLRCVIIVASEDREDLDAADIAFDLRAADETSDFSVGGYNGFSKVTAVNLKR